MANKQANKNASQQTKSSPAKRPSSKKPSNKKKAGGRFIVSIVILVVLTGGFLAGLLYENKIDEALGFRKVETFNPGDMVAIGGLNIHFIDVGQGDACLVELPDDRVMLIDAGENNSTVKAKLKSYIEEVNKTREAEKRNKIEFFDFVIATHSDSDHIGSMAYILDLYHAATFYRPNEECTYPDYPDPALNGASTRNRFWGDYGKKNTLTYKNALAAGYQEHDEFVEGIIINPLGSDEKQKSITPNSETSAGLRYEINFYGPVEAGYSDHNNYSPIIIIEYKDRRIALSGDCEKEGEAAFVATVKGASSDSRYYSLKNSTFYADIIKLGHHGSRTSSSQDYLDIMAKSQYSENIYIVISVNEEAAAKHNPPWIHPHPEVLDRVKAMGILDDNIFRTDLNEDIFFALNFYEGQERAFVENSRGGLVTTVDYPFLNGIIRYRNIGIAIIVLLALILLPTSFIKKAKKQIKKK